MKDTPLEHDKQIWTFFSIGVVSPVIILYFVVLEKLNGYEGWALVLGFSILIYSIFLTLGYGFKKQKSIESFGEFGSYLDYDFGRRLKRSYYPKTKFMAEIILILIGFLYLKAFLEAGHLLIFILILSIALALNCIANCKAKSKYRRKGGRDWQDRCDYLREYICE